MGFFDEYEEQGGDGAYVAEDEKNELIENGTTFPVTAVTREDSPFDDGERWRLTIELPDEDGDVEERFLTFSTGAVESRDKMLEKMEGWLDDPANDAPICKLERVGRSLLLRNAEAEAKPKAKPKATRAAAKPRATRAAAKPATKPTAKTATKRGAKASTSTTRTRTRK